MKVATRILASHFCGAKIAQNPVGNHETRAWIVNHTAHCAVVKLQRTCMHAHGGVQMLKDSLKLLYTYVRMYSHNTHVCKHVPCTFFHPVSRLVLA